MCACLCECAIISFTEHSQWLQRIFSIILHLSPILLSFSCFFMTFVQFAGEYLIFWFLSILICNDGQLRTFQSVCLRNHCLW